MKIQTSKAKHILSGTSDRDLGRNTFMFYLGIDPDVEASGFAVYSKQDKKLVLVKSLRFFELYETLIQYSLIAMKAPTIAHIEGAWLKEKSNWHFDNQRKGVGENIAKKVGANHQVGKLLVEACIKHDLSFIVREPRKPIFENADYFKKVTKWHEQTNKDSRSAANYVFGF